jgi:hypothetical protein
MELARLLDRAARGGSTGRCRSSLNGAQPGIVIDPKTHHTVLPVIAPGCEGGAFRALKRWEAVAGDPYLTRSSVRACAAVLRVVS